MWKVRLKNNRSVKDVTYKEEQCGERCDLKHRSVKGVNYKEYQCESCDSK